MISLAIARVHVMRLVYNSNGNKIMNIELIYALFAMAIVLLLVIDAMNPPQT